MKHLMLAAVAASALASCAAYEAPIEGARDLAPTLELASLPNSGARAPSGDQVLTRIHFGSCLKQKDPMPILAEMVERRADLTVLLGDNVYGDVSDTNDQSMPELVEAYRHLAGRPEFQALVAASPILSTWDDHDFGRNDAGAEFPLKSEAETIFETFWNLPENDIRRTRTGIYGAATIGPEGQRVQLVLLDTRTFRDGLKRTDEPGAPGKERYLPDPDPALQMLGAEQEAWLYQVLRQPADLRIIVSSIQVLAEGHGWEAWRTMPAARERLGQILRASGVQGAIVVSGDRHLGGLYEGEISGVPITELTSSSLNAPQSTWRNAQGQTGHEAGPKRLGEPFYDTNFGELNIDWSQQTVSLTLRDGEGMTVRSKTISFPEQRAAYRQPDPRGQKL